MDSELRRYIVPREDGSYLLFPNPKQLSQTLSENLAKLASLPDWIDSLRRQAKQEAWEESKSYGLVSGLEPGNQNESVPIVLGGHQPELFHPGVWFKNFVLHRIGMEQGCRTLHVIIDHDAVRELTLKVPTLDGDRLVQRFVRFPINESWKMVPWECTLTNDRLATLWMQQINLVIESLRPFGIEPMFQSRKAELSELLQSGIPFSEVTSRLRQRAEQAIGIRNSEVPMSRLASRDAFGKFVYHCLIQSEKLLAIYNQARTDFRSARRITNPVQPIPELRRDGDWCEVPFWLYRNHQNMSQERQGLWVRSSGKNLELANAPSSQAAIHLEHSLDLESWSAEYRRWIEEGICIRPKALMNTLYLRLFVGDLFVHGIGGGLYDVVTDEIAYRLWGISMPQYAVASASLHLPLDWKSEILTRTRDEWLAESHRFRSAPETFLETDETTHRQLKVEFQHLVENVPPKGRKAEWHRKIANLRQKIRTELHEKRSELDQQSFRLIEQERQIGIVRSREYSIGLFPESETAERLSCLARRSLCTAFISETNGKVNSGDLTSLAAGEC